MEKHHNVFTEDQERALNAPLDPRFVSEREGASSKKLKYIKGHNAIDQANRIFGYGNWSHRTLSCQSQVIIDPADGVAIGVMYQAMVELTVHGCAGPIVEPGYQPVASWSVMELVNARRKNWKPEKKALPPEQWEIDNARRTIMEAHEQAGKGAVTDALKRCLRALGEQFANSLYGDGRIEVEDIPAEENSWPSESTKEAYLSYNAIFSIPKMKAFEKRVLKKSLDDASEDDVVRALDDLSKAHFFLEVARVRDPEFKALGMLGAEMAVKNFPIDHPLDIFGHPKQKDLLNKYYTLLKNRDGDLSVVPPEIRKTHVDLIKKLEIKVAS